MRAVTQKINTFFLVTTKVVALFAVIGVLFCLIGCAPAATEAKVQVEDKIYTISNTLADVAISVVDENFDGEVSWVDASQMLLQGEHNYAYRLENFSTGKSVQGEAKITAYKLLDVTGTTFADREMKYTGKNLLTQLYDGHFGNFAVKLEDRQCVMVGEYSNIKVTLRPKEDFVLLCDSGNICSSVDRFFNLTITKNELPNARIATINQIFNGKNNYPENLMGNLVENVDYMGTWQYKSPASDTFVTLNKQNGTYDMTMVGEYKFTAVGLGGYEGKAETLLVVKKTVRQIEDTGTIYEVDFSAQKENVLQNASLAYDYVNCNEGAATAPNADGVILSGGTYLIDGDFNKINITAEAGTIVTLVLKGAHLPCITASNAIKLMVMVGAGTENNVGYISAQNADVYIFGSGTLLINSGDVGITAEKLQITEATLKIEFASSAINASVVAIKNAEISLDGVARNTPSGGGITAIASGKNDGSITIIDTDLKYKGYGNALYANGNICVLGGRYEAEIVTTLVPLSAENMQKYNLEESDFKFVKRDDKFYRVTLRKYKGNELRYALSQRGVAIYAKNPNKNKVSAIVLNTDISLNVVDHGVVAKCGNVFVLGGNIQITSISNAFAPDGLLQFEGGNIEVLSSREGYEAGCVKILAGKHKIFAQDDGINASGDFLGQNSIIILGGELTINALADALDSNGPILISGGTQTLFSANDGIDTAFDADNGSKIEGGTTFATTGYELIELPVKSCTQNVLVASFWQELPAESAIKITDEAGQVVFETVLLKDCNTIIFSASTLKIGSKYNIVCGGKVLAEITITQTITLFGV